MADSDPLYRRRDFETNAGAVFKAVDLAPPGCHLDLKLVRSSMDH